MSHTVYLGLGSNIGDSKSQILRAIDAIGTIHGVSSVRASSLYQTTPVSSLPQRDFLNAACVLSTSLSPEELYDALHRIEVLLGKVPKEKNAPRPIDIDILFFGTHFYNTPELTIPHPHWRTRLFVLKPLSELTDRISVPLDAHGACEMLDLHEYLTAFANPHQERVKRLASASIH